MPRRSALLLCALLAFGLAAGGCRKHETPSSNAGAPSADLTTASATPARGGFSRGAGFTALTGAQAENGTLNGSLYRMEVPNNWNGGLVMYAHGYNGEGGQLSVSNPSIRQHLIAGGYAWAASSYRANGYRPDYGVDDTLALRDLFIQKHGQPRWTILEGTSMGGHVLTASLEQHPGVYQAALAECGALTGIGELDYLAAFAAAGEYIGQVNLFDAPDAREFLRRITQEWLPAVGLGQSPTERGRAFQSAAKYLMGGELPYWSQGLAERVTQALNLILLADPNRSSTVPGRDVDTNAIRYQIDPGLAVTSDELNQNVRRFTAAPGARSAADNPVFAEMTGRISVPVLSLHTTGDAFVPFSVEQEYRRKVDAAGAGDLLVQRGIRRPNHCQFETPELNRAFDDLVQWLEKGVKPAGDDVLTSDLSTLGLRWTTPLLRDDPAQ